MSGLPIPPPGTVDENGVFTAAAQSGSGNLTVSAGGRSVTIPVTVSGHIQELDSFETDAGLSALASTATAAVNVETSSDLVRYGQRSVRVDYNASEGGTATVESNLAIPSGERYLGLWDLRRRLRQRPYRYCDGYQRRRQRHCAHRPGLHRLEAGHRRPA